MTDSVFPVIKTYSRRGLRRNFARGGRLDSVFQNSSHKSVFRDSPVAAGIQRTAFSKPSFRRVLKPPEPLTRHTIGNLCGQAINRTGAKKAGSVLSSTTTDGSENYSVTYTDGTSAMVGEYSEKSIFPIQDSVIAQIAGCSGSQSVNQADDDSDDSNQCTEDGSDKWTDVTTEQDSHSDDGNSDDFDSSLELEILRRQPANREVLPSIDLFKITESQHPDSPAVRVIRDPVPSAVGSKPQHRVDEVDILLADLSPTRARLGDGVKTISPLGSAKKQTGTCLQAFLEKTPAPTDALITTQTPCKVSKFGPIKPRKSKAACSTLLFTSMNTDLDDFFPDVSKVSKIDNFQEISGSSFSVNLRKSVDKKRQKKVTFSSPLPAHKRMPTATARSGSEIQNLFQNELSSILALSSVTDKSNLQLKTPLGNCDLEDLTPPEEVLLEELCLQEKVHKDHVSSCEPCKKTSQSPVVTEKICKEKNNSKSKTRKNDKNVIKRKPEICFLITCPYSAKKFKGMSRKEPKQAAANTFPLDTLMS